MKTLIKLTFLVMITAGISACTSMSSHMTLVKNSPELKPEPGKSLLIFIRPSTYGGLVQATIYDDTTYIGTVSANTKVAYQATPGKHMFMVISESADFMQADLTEGKTYYAQVAPRWGVWKSRFSFIPINGQVSTDDLNQWLKDTTLAKANAQGLNWAKSNQASILQKHDKYLIDWNNKKIGDKQKLFKSSGE